MKSILNSLAVGLGRKLAFELINDVRKEHDVKLSPRSAKAFKEIVSFKVGASYYTTAGRLLQILDSVQSEYIENPKKSEELKKYLDFVGTKIPLLEFQIVNENHQVQFDRLVTFYTNLTNLIK